MLGVDDAPGIAAAVQHLVDLGHTRIAHVAGPQSMVHGRSRREAWSRALRDAGLPEGVCVEADFSAESGAAATRELLDLAEPPTAIVYANDLMAMAGLSLALARGVDVPGELSVTGFDDMEIAAHLQPSLTSVNTDVVAWGRAAATRLLEIDPRRAPDPGPTCPRPASWCARRPAPRRPTPDHPPTPVHDEWSTDETQGPVPVRRRPGPRR